MDKKLGLGALISLVIGSMVGAGVFSLPQNIAAHASAGAVALGWAITGIGMICLALVYQNLSMRRPDLDTAHTTNVCFHNSFSITASGFLSHFCFFV